MLKFLKIIIGRQKREVGGEGIFVISEEKLMQIGGQITTGNAPAPMPQRQPIN